MSGEPVPPGTPVTLVTTVCKLCGGRVEMTPDEATLFAFTVLMKAAGVELEEGDVRGQG